MDIFPPQSVADAHRQAPSVIVGVSDVVVVIVCWWLTRISRLDEYAPIITLLSRNSAVDFVSMYNDIKYIIDDFLYVFPVGFFLVCAMYLNFLMCRHDLII